MVDLRRNYVLPSNAPPLYDVPVPDDNYFYDIAVPKGVLEERCGNRQYDISDPNQSSYIKYEHYSTEENYIYGVPSYGSRTPNYNNDDDSKLDRDAAQLWYRLQRCEQYSKYRTRQPKGGGAAINNQEQVWPDHVEFALCKALCKVRPMGRQKATLDTKSATEDKPRGRNELIAECIKKWTGETRSRKQISSHIQVLKPMVKDDPHIMKYFSQTRLKTCSHRDRYNTSAYRSHNRYNPRSLSSRHLQTPLSGRQHPLLSPPDLHDEVVAPNLIPCKFAMFVRKERCTCGLGDACDMSHEFKIRKEKVTLSTITKFHEGQHQLPDIPLSELRAMQDIFPDLKAVSDAEAAQLRMIFAEANITLPTETMVGAELSIEFEFRSGEDLSRHTGKPCITRFYYDGKPQGSPMPGHSSCKETWLTVPFGSDFWAKRVISKLAGFLKHASRLRNAKEGVDADRDALEAKALQLEEQVNDELKRLSAVQEIHTVPLNSTDAKRTLMIFWKFHHTPPGEQNETRWRNVLTRAPVVKKEHPNNSFNLMSAITLGTHTNAEILDRFNSKNADILEDLNVKPLPQFDPASFGLEDFSAAMAPSGINVNGSIGPMDIGNQPYPNNDIDFKSGHINILVEPVPGLQGLGNYPDPKSIFENHPTAYRYLDISTVVSQAHSPFDVTAQSQEPATAMYDPQLAIGTSFETQAAIAVFDDQVDIPFDPAIAGFETVLAAIDGSLDTQHASSYDVTQAATHSSYDPLSAPYNNQSRNFGTPGSFHDHNFYEDQANHEAQSLFATNTSFDSQDSLAISVSGSFDSQPQFESLDNGAQPSFHSQSNYALDNIHHPVPKQWHSYPFLDPHIYTSDGAFNMPDGNHGREGSYQVEGGFDSNATGGIEGNFGEEGNMNKGRHDSVVTTLEPAADL